MVLNVSIILDHEEQVREKAVVGKIDPLASSRHGPRVFLEAGGTISGTVYAELTKTVIGTFILLELYRRDVSTIAKHGRKEVTTVLLKKLKLGSWNGYIKPGNYKLPFEIDTNHDMIPTIESDLSGAVGLHGRRQKGSAPNKFKPKLVRYLLRLRFPGDGAQRPNAILQHDIFIRASGHPTLEIL